MLTLLNLANSIHQFGTCSFEYEDEEQCKWVPKNGLFNWTVISSNPRDNIHMPTNRLPIHDHTMELNFTGYQFKLHQSKLIQVVIYLCIETNIHLKVTFYIWRHYSLLLKSG